MNHPPAQGYQCTCVTKPATNRLPCSQQKETTLSVCHCFSNPHAIQHWECCSLDALWNFKGAPNTPSQEHATVHGKVHAKADLAPTHPGQVHNSPSLWVKDSAQAAIAMSSHNDIVCSYISQKRDIRACARVWSVWALCKGPEGNKQEKQSGL